MKAMKLFAALLLAAACAQAAPPPLEWDVADHGSAMVASQGALQRLSPAGAPWQTARSEASQSSGVRTIQTAIESLGDGQVIIGLANARASIERPLGADANSLGYWSIGNTTSAGAWGAIQPAPYVAGDVIGMRVDFGAQVVQFQKNGNEWTPPLAISGLGPDLYAAVSMYTPAASIPTVRVVSDDWSDVAEDPVLNIVVVGDSISLTGGALKTYLPRLADEFRAHRRGPARIHRMAINGASWDYSWWASGYPFTLLEDFPRRVIPAMSATVPNWLVMFAGTNGLVVAHHPAAYEYQQLQAYARMAIAAGFRPDHLIVATMLPRAGFSETERAAYNAAIAADTAGLGYRVARLDLDSRIGGAWALADPALFPDGVHPSDAGHEIIKGILFDLFPPEPRLHRWSERGRL